MMLQKDIEQMDPYEVADRLLEDVLYFLDDKDHSGNATSVKNHIVVEKKNGMACGK